MAASAELVKECRNLLAPRGSLCVFRTESQADDEWPALSADPRVRAVRTAQFELPHGAGTRLFLQIGKS